MPSENPPEDSHKVSNAALFLFLSTISVAAVILIAIIYGYVEGVLKTAPHLILLDVLRILIWAGVISCTIDRFRIWMRYQDQKRKTPLLSRCKRYYAIGCAGMLFLAILSFVHIGFLDYPRANHLFIYFVCNIVSIALYFIFIRRIEILCYLEHKTWHIVLVILTYAGLLITRYIWYDHRDPVFVLAFAYLHTPCYVITLITIACGNLKLWMDPEEGSNYGGSAGVGNRTSVPVCNVVDETSPGLFQQLPSDVDCEICMSKYDKEVENQTPRILINCGHTMCQECINKMLASNKHIFCPFCQQVTVVHAGNVENLPKNFAILKLIG